MSTSATAKVQQQFDQDPYPSDPIELSPKDNLNLLFIHALNVPYYRRYQQMIDLQGKRILDVGCGTGYTTLVLAEANPGATLVGIDLSEKSIDIARNRLRYHGFPEAVFYTMSVEELPNLAEDFDFINCDETLYLLPDPLAGLQVMKQVLKPQGIIRANLHDRLHRKPYLIAQNLMRFLGLMEDVSDPNECQMVRDIMESIQDNTYLKKRTWNNPSNAVLKMNYLLENDKGFATPDLFAMLDQAGLEFIDMVDYATWDLTTIFEQELPPIVAEFAKKASPQDKLQLFDLFHTNHRLLDFWCGYPSPLSVPLTMPIEATTYFLVNPVLQEPKLHSALQVAMQEQKPLAIHQYFEHNIKPDTQLSLGEVTCFYWLWEVPQTIGQLSAKWLKTHPFDLVTLAPATIEQATNLVVKALETLHSHMLLYTKTTA